MSIPSSGQMSFDHFRGSKLIKNYKFTPVYSSSGYGNAYAASGMPNDYDSSIYGAVIWPYSGGVGSYGWVGTKVTPTTSSITLKFACDDVVSIYVDDALVLSTGNWQLWYTATIDVVPGKEIVISAYVGDPGLGYRGLAGYIKDSNGNTILVTNSSWVST